MKLIEREFPLREANLFAEYDMTFKYMKKEFRESIERLLNASKLKFRGLPKIHNLMYYPARIPPSATRPVTLASVLEYSPDISKEVFLKAIGLENARKLASESGALVTLYMADPDRELVKKLLGRDPKEITVMDPMAGGGSIPLEALRLGFRTIAGDYNPVAYLILRATIEFPARYGRRLAELVEQEAKELVNYAREALGRFYDEGAKNYLLFIGAEHECGGVVPLAKHTLLSSKKNIHVKPVFVKESKKLAFQISSESPAFTPVICPYCGKSVSEYSIRERWVKEHTKFIEDLLEGRVERAKDAPKIYIFASVQLGKGRYRVADDRDIQLFVEACEELARSATREREEGRDIREYIPLAEIPADNNVFNKLREYGFRYWYQLFNPRQLLVLYKLTKYVRTRVETLSKTYGELGAAVATYLALAIAKIFNYNSILTQWHPGSEVIRDLAGSQYALGKNVDLGYDYCEGNLAYAAPPWVLEAGEGSEEDNEEEEVEATRGGMIPVVRLLCSRLDGLWKDGLDAVYLWDARQLDRYLPEGSVDVINVDPPYYDQHDYAGITEFFWVIMQQALWPVLDVLFPRGRVKVSDWRPEYPEVPRGVEIRGKPPKRGHPSEFARGFGSFLEAASKVLKDDGLLVVWYAYGKLEGWEELFKLFYETGYGVTKTWQVWTQSRQRRIALQREAFFTSMVLVARPRARRATIISYNDPVFEEDVRKTVETSMDALLSMYGLDVLREALVTSLADGFSRVTFYSLPSGLGAYQVMTSKALEVSVSTILNYLARSVARVEHTDVGRLDPVSKLYTFLLIASADDLRVSYDFANRIEQVLRTNLLNRLSVGKERGAVKLLSPNEISKRFYPNIIGKSIKFLLSVEEVFVKHGLRAAEDLVMSVEGDVVSLARLLVAVAWNKLGLSSIDRDTMLNVLSRGGTY
jgi:adenine-specific DNA methylase